MGAITTPSIQNTGATLAHERPALRTLLEGLQFYPNLSSSDLRETAKFSEQTNIMGLPVHAISRPVRDIPASEFTGPLNDLPVESAAGPVEGLRTLFAAEPMLLVRGSLAGATQRPFNLSIVVPQSAAHIAHAFDQLLWPADENVEAESDFALIVWPDYGEQVALHLPAEGLTLALGTDDPRASLLMIVEAAHRMWNERRANHEAAPKVEGDTWEDIQILPGGSFPLRASNGAELVFAGESIPDEWEQWLVQKLELLAGRDPVECLVGGVEPWIIEGGGWISPFWRNPPLPAQLLATLPDWVRAASDPDALPFGVHVDECGEIQLGESDDDAFVIVPRFAVPVPHANSADRQRVTKIWTHKHVKNDAMKLWAIGFPKPEII